ncbi:MAG: serine/threonine protein kinase [Gammaproteobacteria bacterium]|nr:serine/threonine protein kinase [Gammaproteobacteria bacterium]
MRSPRGVLRSEIGGFCNHSHYVQRHCDAPVRIGRALTARATAAVPFQGLTPDVILDLAAQAGVDPDGRLFALNSYENRVYRVGRADGGAVVLKVYRPGRWSDAQIAEEHAFAAELAARDVPVVAPLQFRARTLHHHGGFRFAAFALHPGSAPELDGPGARELLGRTLGRLHAVGALRPFRHRPQLTGGRLGAEARRTVLASGMLPAHVAARYAHLSAGLVEQIRTAFAAARPATIRLHGDCHLGNILWQPQGPVFVDLDDCQQGPRIQDLWMFLSGDAGLQRAQWAELLAGYAQFSELDYGELRLIEALRAARMLNHAAWLVERWADPAFPRAFPWVGEARYWEQHADDLAEQSALVGAPPLLQP